MFGWLTKRDLPHPHARIGVEPFDWQPKRLVEVTYSLKPRDEAEWRGFAERADLAANFHYLRDLDGRDSDPDRDKLDPDIVYWARVGEELWLLADRDWSGWPDPQQYALLVWDPSNKRLRQFGNFGILPDAWTVPNALDQ